MVAVRRFDEDQAMDQIMLAFWREGFLATSIDDLVAATGLKRGSLYAAFGDKEAMFLKAYQRYSDHMEKALLDLLEADDDVETAIIGLFARVLDDLANPDYPAGCLIALIMSEAAGRNDLIETLAKDSFERAETAFYQRLLRGQAAGQIVPGADLRALARFLAATMRSVATVQRLFGDRGMVQDIVNVALASLRPALSNASAAGHSGSMDTAIQH